jgi:hypothetical protein
VVAVSRGGHQLPPVVGGAWASTPDGGQRRNRSVSMLSICWYDVPWSGRG